MIPRPDCSDWRGREAVGDRLLSFIPERIWDVIIAAPISIAIWFALARNLPGIMERWNERRRIRAEEKAADWARLLGEIVRLSAAKQAAEAEIVDLRKERDQCEDGRMHWMERAIIAEAKLQGRGEVREERAVEDAVARLTGRDTP